jgi:NAD(P)-dependent dehydrogenase (short-subunit alcohol dehydrogenase family)
MRGLAGKRFIIAGGSTGTGAATARRLVEEGAGVVVGGINTPVLERTVAEIARNGKAIAVTFDLGEEASIQKLVQTCVDELGGVDGVAIPAADLSKDTLGNDKSLPRMDAKIWERTFKINVMGHALLMKAAIPHMVKAGGGSIVSVSSGGAHAGLPIQPAYAVTKAGLHALVRHVARICGKDNIRCNAVSPGLVLTEGAMVNMTDKIIEKSKEICLMPRLGVADDMASAIAFLLSDEALWLTGQIVSVNGGVLMRD